MMGKPVDRASKLFYTGFSLEDRVPAGHALRAVEAAVDFGFVRREVAHLYGRNGHESVDPTLLLKLMFLACFENVRSERELMRELPLRLDWLWFCGLDLDSEIPDHSVLSKARRRWGVDLFEKVFTHVLGCCERAGLVDGRTVHADSTLLKASAAKDGRVPRRLWEQLEQGLEAGAERPDDGGPPAGGKLNERLVSPTDPDAATHTRGGVGTILGYRDHRLVDDRRGVIVATHVTPADGDDGAQLPILLEQMEARLARLPEEVVGDGQYGTRDNYTRCAELGIRPYLKKRRGKDSPKVGWLSLLPAGCSRWRALELMGRRKSRAEGSFAEAHERHGHRRCRWRRRWRVQIGSYLVAIVQNVKKLIGRRPGGVHTAAATARAAREHAIVLVLPLAGRHRRPRPAAVAVL